MKVIYGICKIDTWVDVRVDEDGTIVLVGMGSKTELDRDGKVVSYSCGPTGLIGRMCQ